MVQGLIYFNLKNAQGIIMTFSILPYYCQGRETFSVANECQPYR